MTGDSATQGMLSEMDKTISNLHEEFGSMEEKTSQQCLCAYLGDCTIQFLSESARLLRHPHQFSAALCVESWGCVSISGFTGLGCALYPQLHGTRWHLMAVLPAVALNLRDHWEWYTFPYCAQIDDSRERGWSLGVGFFVVWLVDTRL